MNEQMRKQLITWKICTDRYNSNGLVQIYSDISISSKNTIVLIQSTHVIWRDQRLACEVRRFGLVTPRFVILSLAVRRTSCGRQTKFNKRAVLLIAYIALLTEYEFHTMFELQLEDSIVLKTGAAQRPLSLPAKYCAKYWATVFDG